MSSYYDGRNSRQRPTSEFYSEFQDVTYAREEEDTIYIRERDLNFFHETFVNEPTRSHISDDTLYKEYVQGHFLYPRPSYPPPMSFAPRMSHYSPSYRGLPSERSRIWRNPHSRSRPSRRHHLDDIFFPNHDDEDEYSTQLESYDSRYSGSRPGVETSRRPGFKLSNNTKPNSRRKVINSNNIIVNTNSESQNNSQNKEIAINKLEEVCKEVRTDGDRVNENIEEANASTKSSTATISSRELPENKKMVKATPIDPPNQNPKPTCKKLKINHSLEKKSSASREPQQNSTAKKSIGSERRPKDKSFINLEKESSSSASEIKEVSKLKKDTQNSISVIKKGTEVGKIMSEKKDCTSITIDDKFQSEIDLNRSQSSRSAGEHSRASKENCNGKKSQKDRIKPKSDSYNTYSKTDSGPKKTENKVKSLQKNMHCAIALNTEHDLRLGADENGKLNANDGSIETAAESKINDVKKNSENTSPKINDSDIIKELEELVKQSDNSSTLSKLKHDKLLHSQIESNKQNDENNRKTEKLLPKTQLSATIKNVHDQPVNGTSGLSQNNVNHPNSFPSTHKADNLNRDHSSIQSKHKPETENLTGLKTSILKDAHIGKPGRLEDTDHDHTIDVVEVKKPNKPNENSSGSNSPTNIEVAKALDFGNLDTQMTYLYTFKKYFDDHRIIDMDVCQTPSPSKNIDEPVRSSQQIETDRVLKNLDAMWNDITAAQIMERNQKNSNREIGFSRYDKGIRSANAEGNVIDKMSKYPSNQRNRSKSLSCLLKRSKFSIRKTKSLNDILYACKFDFQLEKLKRLLSQGTIDTFDNINVNQQIKLDRISKSNHEVQTRALKPMDYKDELLSLLSSGYEDEISFQSLIKESKQKCSGIANNSLEGKDVGSDCTGEASDVNTNFKSKNYKKKRKRVMLLDSSDEEPVPTKRATVISKPKARTGRSEEQQIKNKKVKKQDQKDSAGNKNLKCDIHNQVQIKDSSGASTIQGQSKCAVGDEYITKAEYIKTFGRMKSPVNISLSIEPPAKSAKISKRRATFTCDADNETILKKVDGKNFRDTFHKLFGSSSGDEDGVVQNNGDEATREGNEIEKHPAQKEQCKSSSCEKDSEGSCSILPKKLRSKTSPNTNFRKVTGHCKSLPEERRSSKELDVNSSRTSIQKKELKESISETAVIKRDSSQVASTRKRKKSGSMNDNKSKGHDAKRYRSKKCNPGNHPNYPPEITDKAESSIRDRRRSTSSNSSTSSKSQKIVTQDKSTDKSSVRDRRHSTSSNNSTSSKTNKGIPTDKSSIRGRRLSTSSNSSTSSKSKKEITNDKPTDKSSIRDRRHSTSSNSSSSSKSKKGITKDESSVNTVLVKRNTEDKSVLSAAPRIERQTEDLQSINKERNGNKVIDKEHVSSKSKTDLKESVSNDKFRYSGQATSNYNLITDKLPSEQRNCDKTSATPRQNLAESDRAKSLPDVYRASEHRVKDSLQNCHSFSTEKTLCVKVTVIKKVTNECLDTVYICDAPDIKNDSVVVKQVVCQRDDDDDDVVEITPAVPIIDLTENDEKDNPGDSKQETLADLLLVTKKEIQKIAEEDGLITLYRSEENFLNTEDVQAISASIPVTSSDPSIKNESNTDSSAPVERSSKLDPPVISTQKLSTEQEALQQSEEVETRFKANNVMNSSGTLIKTSEETTANTIATEEQPNKSKLLEILHSNPKESSTSGLTTFQEPTVIDSSNLKDIAHDNKSNGTSRLQEHSVAGNAIEKTMTLTDNALALNTTADSETSSQPICLHNPMSTADSETSSQPICPHKPASTGSMNDHNNIENNAMSSTADLNVGCKQARQVHAKLGNNNSGAAFVSDSVSQPVVSSSHTQSQSTNREKQPDSQHRKLPQTVLQSTVSHKTNLPTLVRSRPIGPENGSRSLLNNITSSTSTQNTSCISKIGVGVASENVGLPAKDLRVIVEIFARHTFFLLHLCNAQKSYIEKLEQIPYYKTYFKSEISLFEYQKRHRLLSQSVRLWADLQSLNIRASNNLSETATHIVDHITVNLSKKPLPKPVTKSLVYLLLGELLKPQFETFASIPLFKTLIRHISIVMAKMQNRSSGPFTEEMRQTLESQIREHNRLVQNQPLPPANQITNQTRNLTYTQSNALATVVQNAESASDNISTAELHFECRSVNAMPQTVNVSKSRNTANSMNPPATNIPIRFQQALTSPGAGGVIRFAPELNSRTAYQQASIQKQNYNVGSQQSFVPSRSPNRVVTSASSKQLTKSVIHAEGPGGSNTISLGYTPRYLPNFDAPVQRHVYTSYGKPPPNYYSAISHTRRTNPSFGQESVIASISSESQLNNAQILLPESSVENILINEQSDNVAAPTNDTKSRNNALLNELLSASTDPGVFQQPATRVNDNFKIKLPFTKPASHSTATFTSTLATLPSSINAPNQNKTILSNSMCTQSQKLSVSTGTHATTQSTPPMDANNYSQAKDTLSASGSNCTTLLSQLLNHNASIENVNSQEAIGQSYQISSFVTFNAPSSTSLENASQNKLKNTMPVDNFDVNPLQSNMTTNGMDTLTSIGQPLSMINSSATLMRTQQNQLLVDSNTARQSFDRPLLSIYNQSSGSTTQAKSSVILKTSANKSILVEPVTGILRKEEPSKKNLSTTPRPQVKVIYKEAQSKSKLRSVNSPVKKRQRAVTPKKSCQNNKKVKRSEMIETVEISSDEDVPLTAELGNSCDTSNEAHAKDSNSNIAKTKEGHDVQNCLNRLQSPKYINEEEQRKDRNTSEASAFSPQGIDNPISLSGTKNKDTNPLLQSQDEIISSAMDLLDHGISADEDNIETIDLTWIDDMDETELQGEIDLVIVKQEHVHEKADVQDIRVVASPADSGIASPPIQYEEDTTYTVVRSLCVCGQIANYSCACGDGWYCGQECQLNDWESHQNVCHIPIEVMKTEEELAGNQPDELQSEQN